MAEIKIFYSQFSYDNIIEKIKCSLVYSDDEKAVLVKMLFNMKHMQFLLYAIDVLRQEDFNCEIYDFERYKKYIVCETYRELIEQFLEKNKDCEEVYYDEIRSWFKGMTIDIELLQILDERFRAQDTKLIF